MTGIPAADAAAFSMNLPIGTVQGNFPKNMEQSFADIMNGRENQMEASTDAGRTKAPIKATENENRVSASQESNRSQKITKESADKGKSGEKLAKDEAAQVEETVKELKEEIADTLDVTMEELEAAMETLGLSFGELMNPANLARLAAEVVEEVDGLTLVTDEALFEGLKELAGQVEVTVEALARELGMEPEEISVMLEEAGKLQGQGPEEIAPKEQEPKVVSEVPAETTGKAFEASKDLQDEAVPEDRAGKYQPVKEETAVTEADAQSQQTSQDGLEDQRGEAKNHKDLGQEAAGSIQQQTVFAEGNAVLTKTEAPLPVMDAQSILNQIGEAVRVTGGEEFTSMEMQLHPESLGTLHLQVRAKEGLITAQFTTESEAVKQVLEAQVVQLREKLEAQGVKVEAVEVLVASHEFERNLEKGGSEEKNTYEAKKVTRRKINLNVLEGEEESDLSVEEQEAAEIQKDMMERNGNTLDYMV